MTQHIIRNDASVIDALRRINLLSGGVMTLAVVDENDKMLGTVTDGDIRRALINGVPLNHSIETVVHTEFTALREGCRPVDKLKAMREARNRGLRLLPELSRDGKIVRLIDLELTPAILPLRAILMAGGKGERLRPLTLDTPKPLLKIAGREIIDYNIENIARCGISDVWVTVRYLGDMIREFFAVPRHGVKVRCVGEDAPLGTIGAATLVPQLETGDTLVMNSDLLTTINLEEMYLHHIAEKADVTIAAIPYTVSVPYAILATDGDSLVKGLEEKPTYTHLANAGIYIFSNKVLNTLQHNQRTDAPTLIENAINSGARVTYYPINGTWIDIGSPSDFRHAEELMKQHRSLGNM